MLIKRSVKVKIIMTDITRKQLKNEFLGDIRRLKIELEQLEFQIKKLINEAKKKNIDYNQVFYKAKKEQEKRIAKLEQLEIRVKEVVKVANDVELDYSTIDSYYDIAVGDNWEKVYNSPEIILKDGIIVEIRE